MDAVDLTGARVFRARHGRQDDRWYVLPDGRVLYDRNGSGELEKAIHSESDVLHSEVLIEVDE